MGDQSDWRDAPPRPVFAGLKHIDDCGDWYAVYEVAPDTYALCEPRHEQEVISFLLTGATRALLVDTGMGVTPIRPVVERLTHLPVSVLNTHSHFDHIGGNWEFEEILGFDTPLARSRQEGGFQRTWAEQLQPGYVRGALPAGVDPATHSTRLFRYTGFVKEGDRIDLGARTLEIFHAPGHSSDSIAILDRGRRLLLTADTFYEGPIFLMLPDSGLPDLAATARKLAALTPHVNWLLPSHNAPRASPAFLPALSAAAESLLARGARPGERARFDGFSLWL
jgi:glyoxylase-like metal-dependent hydrolase (beta-lactamase superfamily II)